MPLFRFEIELPPDYATLIEALRGDVPRDEFLLRCIELGLLDLQDEANRVQRDFLTNWANNATEFYKTLRATRKLSVRKSLDVPPDKPKLPRDP